MEWTPSAHDLLPVSLHTFEKLPQVVRRHVAYLRLNTLLMILASFEQAEGLAKSVTDPGSRLTVLLLPSNTGGDATLAILPFFQEDLDLEGLAVDAMFGSTGMTSWVFVL
jgi:cleavage and polyadenylation specificity factor subunit 1